MNVTIGLEYCYVENKMSRRRLALFSLSSLLNRSCAMYVAEESLPG